MMVDDVIFHVDRLIEPDLNQVLILLNIFTFKRLVASFSHKCDHILGDSIGMSNQKIVEHTALRKGYDS